MTYHRGSSRRAYCALSCGLLAIAAGWTLGGVALAQAPATGLKKSDINGLLKDKVLSPAQQQQFDAYFVRFFKLFDTAAGGPHDQLPRLRAELRNYLKYGKSGPAHDHLNEMTYKQMVAIVKGSKPIATKYTAMLILGELNSQDAEAGKTLTPYAPSLHYLKLAALNERVPDVIRMTGLIGLERFAAEGGIPAADKPAVTAAMLKLMQQQSPPPTRTAEGHVWMRRSAAGVLAALGSPGTDDAVVKAMEEIIADPQAEPSLRCDTAQYLGQLKFPAESQTDFPALANLLGHQTVEVCTGLLGTGNARANSPPDEARLRRQLAHASFSTLHGLDGVYGGTGVLAGAKKNAEARDFATELRAKVEVLCQALEESETVNVDDVKLKLDDLATGLRDKPEPPAAAPAEEKKDQTAELTKQPDAARATVARPASGGN